MTDPQGPYQPPSPYPPGYAQPYAPVPHPYGPAVGVPGSARAAGVLLGIVGALVLLGSALMVIVILVLPAEEFASEISREDIPPQMTLETFLNLVAGCFGVCGGVVSLTYLALTPFVWKGSRTGIIIAIVVVGLSLILVLLNLVASTLEAGALALVVNLIPLALFGVVMIMLVRAVMAVNSHQQYLQASQMAAWAAYQQAAAPPPGWGAQQGWGGPPQGPS